MVFFIVDFTFRHAASASEISGVSKFSRKLSVILKLILPTSVNKNSHFSGN